jgi:hypothetical protein
MNFFPIDAFAHSTVRGSLIITQLEIRTESQLALGKLFFFLIDALAHSMRFGGSLVINQLEIRNPTRLEFEIFFFYRRGPGALLLSSSSRFEPRVNLHWKNNFFF